MRIPGQFLLFAALGASFLACGGGGGSSAPVAPVSSFTVTAATLTLPVPPVANQSLYPAP